MKKLITLLLAFLLLCSCSPKSSIEGITYSDGKYSMQIFAMDTVMTLTSYGKGSDEALLKASEEIFRLESMLSTEIDSSEVSSINSGGSAAVSDETLYIIQTALQISELTGGAFDISIAPVVREWGFISGDYHIPDAATLSSLLKNVDYSKISVSGNSVSLGEGMSIDLGAIAKGYAGQKCADLLKELGVESAILALGGNVQTVGAKPDGSLWKVAIQDPLDIDSTVGVLRCSDTAVVTSGGYQRYFEENGMRYHHIINPVTGFPADSGLISATVICPDGTLADALSTFLFVLGLEKSLDYYSTYGGFEAILITSDQEIIVTPGIAESFTFTASDTGYTCTVLE